MLARRLDQLEDEAYLPTAGLTAAVLALAAKVPTQPDHGAIERIRYFRGQLLDAGDLDAEADYRRRKRRQIFAPGIVAGLSVGVQAGRNGSTIIVSPGYAVDNRGRSIVLDEPVTLTASLTARRILVIMRPERRGPASVMLRALAGWFLIVEEPERDDVLLECLERTSRGWQIDRSA
jgi:hypothetical protein